MMEWCTNKKLAISTVEHVFFDVLGYLFCGNAYGNVVALLVKLLKMRV